jgi:hypothetical protein
MPSFNDTPVIVRQAMRALPVKTPLPAGASSIIISIKHHHHHSNVQCCHLSWQDTLTITLPLVFAATFAAAFQATTVLVLAAAATRARLVPAGAPLFTSSSRGSSATTTTTNSSCLACKLPLMRPFQLNTLNRLHWTALADSFAACQNCRHAICTT